MLATSREPIRVRGEVTYQLLPLLVPGLDADEREALRSPAVLLFAERGAAVRPDFRLTTDNIPSVAEISRMLDGIPLALELAAARVGVMSPAQIADRLDHRFRLLTSGQRDDLAHHRTLEATIDWSYELLTNEEQNLFASLSVFRGGFDLEAVEGICVGDNIRPFEVVDLVSSLVNRSLIVADQTGTEFRYRLLETLHEYADHKLDETGEKAQLQSRHASHYVDRAESLEVLTRSDEETAFGRYQRDYQNLITALEWCLERDETELSMRLLAGVAIYWHSQGIVPEGDTWIKTLLESPGSIASAIRAKALIAAALVSRIQVATTYSEEAVQILRRLDDQSPEGLALLARALSTLGASVAEGSGDIAGAVLLTEEARDLAHRAGDTFSEAINLLNLAEAQLDYGNLEVAAGLANRAIAIHRDTGRNSRLADGLGVLGEIELKRGKTQEGEGLLRESIRIATEHRFRPQQIDASQVLAGWLVGQGALIEAKRLLASVLPLLESAPAAYVTSHLVTLASAREAEGHHTDAVSVIAAASANAQRPHNSLAHDQQDISRVLDAARSQLTADNYEKAWQKGHTMTLSQALGYATQLLKESTA